MLSISACLRNYLDFRSNQLGLDDGGTDGSAFRFMSVELGALTAFFGPSRSYKTSLAIAAMYDFAKKGRKVLYLSDPEKLNDVMVKLLAIESGSHMGFYEDGFDAFLKEGIVDTVKSVSDLKIDFMATNSLVNYFYGDNGLYDVVIIDDLHLSDFSIDTLLEYVAGACTKVLFTSLVDDGDLSLESVTNSYKDINSRFIDCYLLQNTGSNPDSGKSKIELKKIKSSDHGKYYILCDDLTGRVSSEDSPPPTGNRWFGRG